jgi:ribonucleotide monophosphatase NagD (HAD superfamily)
MVGDRPATDGVLASQLGVPFALVLSGVTRAGDIPDGAGTAATAKDLVSLVRAVLDGTPA